MARRKEPAETTNPRRFADLLFQVVHQIGFGCFQCGPETEQQGGDETKEESRRDHGDIGREIENKREVKVSEQGRERIEQEIVAPNAEDESDQTAANGKQESFGEELPDDPPARGADRQADRDFFGA